MRPSSNNATELLDTIPCFPAWPQPNPPPRLEQFRVELETAINHGIIHKPYRKASVIAFHWENDDIGVDSLEDELLNVFKTVYGFDTQSFTIPLLNSQLSLLNCLLEWSSNKGEQDTLRILIYSGHADSAGTTSARWDLGGRMNQQTGTIQGPKINWWDICGNIEQFPGDVCYIFDTCSAGSGALSAYNGAEFLGASTYEQTATARIHFSFTHVLIDELKHLNGKPQTLASIYGHIYRFAQQNQVGAAPIHIPKRNYPSVTIARGGNVPSHVDSIDSDSDNDLRILLSVKIREGMPPDLNQWKAWLTRNIPDCAQSAKVTVQGGFRGSTTLLLTVPVKVWTMLPANDPSYSFIGHVTSDIFTNQQLPSTSTLPTRFASPARENQRPGGSHFARSLGWKSLERPPR